MSQLFIKGILEPIKITREEALQVAKIMENEKVDKERTITVSVWTGKKKDVRFVVVEKDRTYQTDAEFSNEEMRIFETMELKNYLVDGLLPFKNQLKFYADNGVMNVRELIDDPKTSAHFEIAVVDPTRYAELRDKISYWIFYKGKIAFAKKKELEALEAIAQEHA